MSAPKALFVRVAGLATVLLMASPAFAQTAETPQGSERERAAAGAAGDAAKAEQPGTEHHPGGPGPEGTEDEEEPDPSKHFNYVGIRPGHLFDYRGKDEYGGPFGDGKMVDPQTGHEIHEEEPASPPYLFMLFNFAILLGILAWKGWPFASKAAAERHDLIKTALDEAAKLRTQAADKLAEYEARLADADAEIKKLVEGMRADAENDKKRILLAAEAQAQQMKRDAELRIAAEIELARAQLTREVTAAAASATEKLLRDKMTPGDQQMLVTAFITDVQNAGVTGRAPGTTPGTNTTGQVR
ncbi:MAG TPA: ATP synthase F0 subunit B [Kofleriaceae bacterium]|jgi:F-type H+-transporting ATPase subunit b|nr:ATP synthase F0 subunit B [Kofleriaceae bacterium]